jgi:O-antigen ligase
MGSQMSSYLLYFGVGITALAWGLALIPRWARVAERRGGKWYLEGVILICGPLTMSAIAMYPKGLQSSFSGPFPVINRWLSYAAILLVVIAIAKGLRRPRNDAGPLIAAAAFFYFALVLSCFGGASPSFPEPYWVTPLVVMAFLIHGNYTYEWFLNTARIALRLILALSFIALLDPAIGFNYDELRTFAGLSRMQGIAQHPNTFAFMMVLGLIIELGTKSRIRWKVPFVVGLILAQSTTAFLMAAAALVIISTPWRKTARVLAALGAFVFACAALVSPAWVGGAIESALPATASSLNGRTTIWSAVIFGFQQNPVFGYGPGLLDEDYRQQYLPSFDAAAQAHSQWYQTLGGTGIVGILSLVILGLVLLLFAIRSRNATGGLTMAIFVVMVIRGITETPLRPSGISATTFCLVIVLVLIASAPKDEVAARPKREAGKGLPRAYAHT